MRLGAVLLGGLIAAAWPVSAAAYLKFGVRIDSRVVDVRWAGTVAYFINEREVPGVTATALRDAVVRAFRAWEAVDTAQVRSTFVGFTTAPPLLEDRRTTIGFVDRPDLERVLGATSFVLDARTGEILEADIFFNTRFSWSVAPGGEQGRIDLESVAVHEIGHLLGLGHSAIGETEMLDGGRRRVLGSGAVMFPIAFAGGSVADRSLQPDDIAGISDVYPAPGLDTATGTITGRVTMNGRGVFGAHVLAISLDRGTLVGGFSLTASGEFVIARLPPGAYLLRVEPLDDADPESFFSQRAETGFDVSYAPRVIVVPAGGSSGAVEVAVRPRAAARGGP